VAAQEERARATAHERGLQIDAAWWAGVNSHLRLLLDSACELERRGARDAQRRPEEPLA
jgi:hypothetical protein